MIIANVKSRCALATLPILAGLLIQAAGVQAAGTAPVKQVVTSYFGWEVDKTTEGRVCTVESGHECQAGRPSSKPGGFEYSESVAGGGPNGNIYVADRGNRRVQELEPGGTFVLMFGRKVNKKGGGLCTKAEESECQGGEEGAAAGQFGSSMSVTVDPANGNLYVAETVISGGRFGSRVQEFTASGVFVREIGKEVNETAHLNNETANENLCPVKVGDKCKGPALREPGTPYEWGSVHGAFNFPSNNIANLLAVGGNKVLYVGDEKRVQEFETATGAWIGGQIPLPGTVKAIATDQTGDVYLTEGETSSIREFDPAGKEITTLHVPGGASILAIARDSAGRIAVSENASGTPRGSLYDIVGTILHLSTEFASRDSEHLAFDSKRDLYAAVSGGTSLDPAKHEVIAYKPVPVGELVIGASVCVPGSDIGTDATLDCTLNGEVDPWGVKETEVWFQWGRTPALGEETHPKQPTANTLSEGEEEPPVRVSAAITGVRPNEPLYDRLAGEDHNVKAPELLSSPTSEFTTPSVPPRVVGEPIVSFIKPSSAVMFGHLNPENTLTSYAFQSAPAAICKSFEESCTGILEAKALTSPVYSQIGVAQEVTGLQPSTRYRYRLSAINGKLEKAVNLPEGEGEFETAPARAVQAETGGANMMTTTSAVVYGSVNPDGQASTYTFEMGVYNGAATRYGILFSGPAGAGAEPVAEYLAVTGLQPGTTYAYRIAIHFGDGSMPGSSATGATRTFTTEGLPAVLVGPASLSMLSVPPIAFPKEPAKVTPKKLTRAQQLANALKACKKQRKKQRASCERTAHKKYPTNNKKKK
jgi:hypothetical protein